MLARIFGSCVVVAVLGLIPAAAAPATFQAGEDAYVALHFAEARAAYQAAASSGSTKDRADALRQLGVMAWRLDGNGTEAERYFRDALSVGVAIGDTQAERERFLASVGRFDEATAAADAAVAVAATPAERHTAMLAYAHSILTKLKGIAIAKQTSTDAQRLSRARDLMRAASASPPLPLDLSEALLEVALRLDDGPLALTAWLSYAREGADTGAWAPAARTLKAALPAWRAGASAAVRRDVFEGLRLSQFFSLAALVAADVRVAGTDVFSKLPRVAETIAYAGFLNGVETTTDSYYRDIANGHGNVSAWRAALASDGQTLWSKLDGVLPAFSEAALAGEIKTRFGAYINLGETGGVQDLHYGHVFIDDPRTIEQYGHRASIRRVALDRIVSNGYESWVWDGRQAHGGWADADRVVQIRPGYADGALRIWDRITDPAQRAEVEQRLKMLSTTDDGIAAQQPIAFLPGLATRLEWQGENAILDRLRAKGVGAAELKGRFLIEQSRIKLESNFYAHEGRHVLDKLAFDNTPQKLEPEELEFRAKLSEVAFSEEPRVCFGSILNPNIADATSPHGRANKRVVEGLVRWMDARRREIAGIDVARPLLPQLDRLSDDQLRAAMRSMDPWAKAN